MLDETRLVPFGDLFSISDLDNLEDSAKFKLPPEFRSFFLRNRGCFIDGNSSIQFSGLTSDVLQFHGKIGLFDPLSNDTAALRLGDPKLGFPEKSINFADDLGGNSYYLAPEHNSISVYWMGYLTIEGGTKVAASFQEFIDQVVITPFED